MTIVHPGQAPNPVRRTVGRALSRTVDRVGPAALSALRELVLVAVLFEFYRLGRLLARDEVVDARHHAEFVHRLEHVLRLPSEADLQALVPSDAWLHAANVYYVSVHFPAMIAFLVWGYVFRPRWEYVWARNLVIALTGAALVVHILYPLAPPRMFPQWGFEDTMAVLGPDAYAGASGDLANQFAAMPSLHIGWAALIAYVVHRTGPKWLAWIATVHLALTTVVVVVTANHYWMDGIVAVALLAVASRIVRPKVPADAEEPQPTALELSRETVDR
jgi:hypothetical protein